MKLQIRPQTLAYLSLTTILTHTLSALLLKLIIGFLPTASEFTTALPPSKTFVPLLGLGFIVMGLYTIGSTMVEPFVMIGVDNKEATMDERRDKGYKLLRWIIAGFGMVMFGTWVIESVGECK